MPLLRIDVRGKIMAESSEPLSPKETLQSFLGEGKRPSPDELKQKNILKHSTVAPALVR